MAPAPDPILARLEADLLAGRLDAAEAGCRRVLEAGTGPGTAHARELLGLVLQRRGDAAGAVAAFEALVAAGEARGSTWSNLAGGLQSLGRRDEALEALRRGVSALPQDPGLRLRFAGALADAGSGGAAEQEARAVLVRAPGQPDALRILGLALHLQGRHAEAADALRSAVAARPGDARALGHLGNALLELEAWGEAEGALRASLAADPAAAESWYSLGVVCDRTRRFEAAADAYRRALQLRPDWGFAWGNLARALQWLGDAEGQRKANAEALARLPRNLELRSNHLLALNYMEDLSPFELRHAHLDEGRAWTVDEGLPGPLPEPGARIRVGFVSGDLRDHPVAAFLEGPLAHLDRGAFHLAAYHAQDREDAVTARLRDLMDAWVDCHALDGAALARRIREDGIHVLVDLSGHTAYNRLDAFGRRPAPVQAAWVGYPNTTGLPVMDFRLTDARVDPPGEDAQLPSSEILWRLPFRQAWRPDAGMPDPGPAPGLARGAATFASLNNPSKLNGAVLAAWSEILREVPGSRLRVMNMEPRRLETLRAAFAARAVDPARVEGQPRLPRGEYWASLGEVDVALDPWPFNGGTTTCQAAWLGIPTVALAGDRPAARTGASLLAAMGLEDWVAADRDAYVALAARWGRDLEGLAALRAALRARVAASALLDHARMARDLEAAFRGMIEAKQPGGAAC
jgi:predicted O-linked N-acetylglucosamine transferase (SPINDLY family)